jgi:RNA polymerase sigma factor (sigma-70 family)
MPAPLKHIDAVADERDLLMRIAGGDERALSALVDRYWEFVFNAALHHSKSYDQSEIITQDVFIRLWNKREHLTDIVSIKGFLFILMRNEIIDAIRRNVRKLKVSELQNSELIADQSDGGVHSEVKQLRELLEEGMKQLPEKQQQAFRLCKIEGYSYPEAAAMMQTARGTVAQHISRATNTMRVFLRTKGIDEFFILLLFMSEIKK